MIKKSPTTELSLAFLGNVSNRLGESLMTKIIESFEKENIDIVDLFELAQDEPESKDYSYDNVEINVFQWSDIWSSIAKNPSKFMDFANKGQNRTKIAYRVLTMNPSSILDIENPEIMGLFISKPGNGTLNALKLDNEKTEKTLSQAFASLRPEACIRWMKVNNLDKDSQIMGHNIIKLLQDNTHIKDYTPFMLTVEDFDSRTNGMAKNKHAELWAAQNIIPDGDLKVKRMAHMLANELRTAENPYSTALIRSLIKKFPDREIWHYRFDTSESVSDNRPKSIIDCLIDFNLMEFRESKSNDILLCAKKQRKSQYGNTVSNSFKVIKVLNENLKMNPEQLKKIFINIINQTEHLLILNDPSPWINNNLDFIKKNVFPQIVDSDEICDAVIKLNASYTRFGPGRVSHVALADAFNTYAGKTKVIEKFLKRMCHEKCGLKNEAMPILNKSKNRQIVITSKNRPDFNTLPKIAFNLYERKALSIDELVWFIKVLPAMDHTLFPGVESIEGSLSSEEDDKIDDFLCVLYKRRNVESIDPQISAFCERLALRKTMMRADMSKPKKGMNCI